MLASVMNECTIGGRPVWVLGTLTDGKIEELERVRRHKFILDVKIQLTKIQRQGRPGLTLK